MIEKPYLKFPDTTVGHVALYTKFIADEIKHNGKSVRFYCGITSLYGKEYLVYLDKKDSLCFIQIEDKFIRKIYIAPILKKLDGYYISGISNNQLSLLNNENKTFYQYTIGQDLALTLTREISLNKSGKLTGIDFCTIPDASRFVVKDSLLFINYSSNMIKKNINRSVFIYFNLNEPVLQPRLIIDYPANYERERIYAPESLFAIPNDSSLLFGYAQSDVLGIFNIRHNTVIQTSINRKTGYIPFDETKEKNLGYVSKYLQTNETNYKLFSDSSAQRMYLFKRLARAQKTDTTVMECYIFDTQLNPVYYFKLNQEVCPSYIYKYQKGFLAFTKDFTKAYYYAF